MGSSVTPAAGHVTDLQSPSHKRAGPMTEPGGTCRWCGEPIHQEPSPPPFSPTWVHDEDDRVVCYIELAHPTLPVMDNALLAVRVAEPRQSET